MRRFEITAIVLALFSLSLLVRQTSGEGQAAPPVQASSTAKAGLNAGEALQPSDGWGKAAGPAILINEVRTDQTGTDNDEYFELVGAPGASLDGLTYIVIGDTGGGSGIVEAVVPLSGFTIPPDGHFLAVESTFTLAPPTQIDFNTGGGNVLNFENTDNVTHMLVADWTGTLNMDVDVGDDCVIDEPPPWSAVLDRIAIIIANTGPPNQDCFYNTGPDDVIGPDGTFAPGHVYRLPDAGLPWNIGPFNPMVGNDTPGTVNQIGTGACCVGGSCTIETIADCVNVLGGLYKGTNVPCTPSPCIGACCNSLNECQITDADTCFSNGGVFQGDNTPCPPNPPCGACMTLEDVRGMPVNSRVKPCNLIITSTTDLIQSGTVKSFQAMDLSGPGGQSGITMFGSNGDIDQILAGAVAGTEIDIQGVTSSFNGLLEVVSGSLPLKRTRLGTTGPAPQPVDITIQDLQNLSPTAEGLESELVTLSCVTFVDAGGTFMGGLVTSDYVVTNGVQTAIVRIASNQLDFEGQTIPSGQVNITGIFSQDDFTAPFDSFYELLPRSLADVVPASGCPVGGACCLGDGECVLAVDVSDCAFMGGLYSGDGTDCADLDEDAIPDAFESNDCGAPWNLLDLCRTRTSPFSPDTDADGFRDGDEAYLFGTNPCVPDADCNGNFIPDLTEISNGSRPDRNGNLIPDVCEYPACTSLPGDTSNDGLVNGIDIHTWIECYLGDVSLCQCADMNEDYQFTEIDVASFVTELLAVNVNNDPRCDNCHAFSETFWECHHWASDANGAACSTTTCIENVIDTATCDFHPTARGPRQCNTDTAAGAKWIQRIHKSSCPGGTVNWVVGYDFTVGCTVCADNSIYVSCVVSPCSSNLLRGPFDRGTRHACGCP